MKQISIFITLLLLSVRLLGQDNYFRQTYVFNGSIRTDKGQELKINMNFLILLDSTIVGSYYYTPKNGSLKLVGHLNSDNSFILAERNESDSITGFFNGILASDKKSASGEWTTPSRDKSFDFSVNIIEEKSYWDYIKKNRSLYEYSDFDLVMKESDKVLSIDVGDKGIDKLPVGLGKLKRIVSFNLLGNDFTSFPLVLARLTSLEEISLSTNKLTEISTQIRRLKNLRILIMNNNKLVELPREIGELTNLLYLDIGNNKLKSLPKEIQYLTNLQELHIERNALNEKEKQRIKKLLPNCVIHF
ncbi:leucine-rich repeat domain-containing protein [Sediminibacterium goheungense]|uniref:Leucine rich repeat (LRR) protein n=1 Tax=Sediminibacterium goheungense TaxID=1086393 RepID=A0A4R6IV88_9BACT|nr:leucine-rich repeat domain-containing protein [Sediminibacterium goheungense]TDO25795.1 leucine rich repeat (LRR) protein [Sediminibacterium goheungense]